MYTIIYKIVMSPYEHQQFRQVEYADRTVEKNINRKTNIMLKILHNAHKSGDGDEQQRAVDLLHKLNNLDILTGVFIGCTGMIDLDATLERSSTLAEQSKIDEREYVERCAVLKLAHEIREKCGVMEIVD
jgi:hypothetical protein